MENAANVSSEEELLKLYQEGKITEDEYKQLLGAMRKPAEGNIDSKTTSHEPEFHAFRKRVLIGAMIICWIGLPMGFALHLPLVWTLSILGIIIVGIKMHLLNK